ncbi:hypothetical protein DID96_31415 [Burkholderia sp. Bp8963]|nr:hypothetical protein DID96_31415 [Burkholderia sp. Bp8963]
MWPSVQCTTLLAGCGCGCDGSPGTGTQPPAQPTPQPGASKAVSSFALAVLPDTQFYARYATVAKNRQLIRKYGSEPFRAQTQWVASNAATLNIPFLIHLGDVVDQQSKEAQWMVANSAMQVLENAKVPYSILAGNHDVILVRDYVDASSQGSATDKQRDLTKERYLQWFGTARAKRQATFGGRDPSGFHEYRVFTAEGQKFLVLSLSWRISDDGLAWANKVIRDNPTLPVILVNHQFLNIDKDGVSPLEVPYGKMLWDGRLLRQHWRGPRGRQAAEAGGVAHSAPELMCLTDGRLAAVVRRGVTTRYRGFGRSNLM